MFSRRYDHQTEAKTGAVFPFGDYSDKHQSVCLWQSACFLSFHQAGILVSEFGQAGLPFSEFAAGFVLSDCLSRCMIRGAIAPLTRAFTGSNQAYRAISTSQLKALPLLHLWPIDVVVFHGSQGRPCFEGGFPLRCLQRLSCPNIATQHYRWHDNWSTSGSFNPVLSY